MKQEGKVSRMEFATQLQTLRQAAGLSQEALAKQLFVSRQAVSKWENGEATPDLNTLVKLAAVLQVSLDQLVLGHVAGGNQAPAAANEPGGGRPMNGWEWLARYWWLLFAVGGFVVWFVDALWR